MYSSLKALIVLTLIVLASGCATKKHMPLGLPNTQLDSPENSLLVGRLTIVNENRSRHHPDLTAIVVSSDGRKVSYINPTLI